MRMICIKQPPVCRPWGYGWEEAPRVGDILTVRHERISPYSGRAAYVFHEIHNPPAAYEGGRHEVYFLSRFFRRLPDHDVRNEANKKVPENV